MSQLFAQPYALDAAGFYFESADEFSEKMAQSGVEEFEIQFIDGEDADAQLFAAAGIHQGNLAQWFDEVESLEDDQKVALYVLLDTGYSLDDALGKTDDVSLYQGRLLDAAIELFEDCYAYTMPENLRFYIDYEKFARDCELGGDMREFEFDHQTYTCTNMAGI